ncbi:MAG: endopeptidase La [Oscillospiraceae bacterium]|nr:endopeptidase La [Oscillospiraceae bacterium]
MNQLVVTETLPVIALRGLSVFPEMLTHFDVGREKSAKALEVAMKGHQYVFLVAQKNIIADNPGMTDLCPIGTVAYVKQMLKIPGDMTRVLVEGKYRAHIVEMTQTDPYLSACIESVPEGEIPKKRTRVDALLRHVREQYEQYQELAPKILPEYLLQIMASENPGYIADFIAQTSTFPYQDKQLALEQLHPMRRLELVDKLLTHEIEVLKIEGQLQEKTQESISKNQHDYVLREQMRAIRSELGEDDEENEVAQYRRKIHALKLAQSTEEKLIKETDRLAKQPNGSSESAVIRNYLDVCLELPWNQRTKERVDVAACRKQLNRDHFGLEKVKQRVLEMIAARQLSPNMPGPIICLVGPPGVGKTSIAISIAKCLNRKLCRISLGGVHDEADIRGHRKTYIGAMPGRIMAGLQQAGSKNPLMLLDEIDKMGADYRGDPSSALLEVLDAEQNGSFRDHFVELPFDLRECLFMTTANTTDTIPRPLLDRMEVIELGSYTDNEKLHIAKEHLLPKQIKKYGLTRARVQMTDDALRETIACYTRESGVRALERELATVCRKAAMAFVEQPEKKRMTVNSGNLESLLGPCKFLPDSIPETDQIGLVTGLAWTSVGGETLEVEVNVAPGSGKLELTGNLGDVMKESCVAAMSYIRANAELVHVDPEFYKTKDLHVHFPEGAIPKDGPSAGIAICTAMVSALSGAPVRRDLAMTGEISIRGRVLAIGGLREKTMAALRHGVHTVIIPAANEKDLQEIDQEVRSALNFITVKYADAVLHTALNFSACQEKAPMQLTEPLGELKVNVQPEAGKKSGTIRQ